MEIESAYSAETLAYLATYNSTGPCRPDKSLVTDDRVITLQGVHHSARPTWKLRATVEFYRDILGLKLLHCIAAKGWGPPGHADFLHFFFDTGRGSTLAFFYYLGTDQPEWMKPVYHYMANAVHTAWNVPTRAELESFKALLESRGVACSAFTRHEIIESLYVLDPNGYVFEMTTPTRDTTEVDAVDGNLTLEAVMQLEDEAFARSEPSASSMEALWRRKRDLVAASMTAKG
jgi:catechol 2,3-dioxygenase-like lactoylglutathione lyase family enzyme